MEMGQEASSRSAVAGLRRGRSPEILTVCVELLGEIGYERLTIDAVAARARASKATIYRRWSCKSELVAEALRLRARTNELTVVDSGDLRSDLIGLMQVVRAQFSDQWPLLAGLLHAMRSDPELALLMRREIHRCKEALSRLLERRIAGDGGSIRDNELLQEILPGQIVLRMLVGESVDDSYLTRLVDGVLLPLLVTGGDVYTDDLPGGGSQRAHAVSGDERNQ